MPIKPSIQNKFLLLLFLSLQVSCTYAIRNSYLLENDTKFIYESSQKDILQKIKSRKELKLYKKNITDQQPDLINDIAATEIRLIDLGEGETKLKSLSISKDNPVYLANLSRLYYLTDEYRLIKDHYNKILPEKNRSYIHKLISIFDTHSRYEEKIILMDILQHIHGFEYMAMEELAIYHYTKNDFQAMEEYFETILASNPFHKSALYYMSHMSHDIGNYEEALMYAQSLLLNRNIDTKFSDIYLIASSSWMQLNKPAKALNIINSSPADLKKRPEFLTLWRKILLILNPKSSLDPLRPYVQILSKNGINLDNDEFLLKKSGQREILLNTIYGK